MMWKIKNCQEVSLRLLRVFSRSLRSSASLSHPAIARPWASSTCGLVTPISPPSAFRPSLPRQPVALLCTKTTPKPQKDAKTVTVTFIDRDGDEVSVKAKLGDTLLEVAHENDIDLEGACEGTLSCSTCHLIVDPEWFDKIPDPLTEEEQDMLDLAYGLTDTSRLGCQIVVTRALDGIRFTVPSGTSDARIL